MKVDITDRKALSNIEPGAVRAYLDAHGWHHVEPYGDHGDVYHRDESPEIIAPTSRSLRDYPRRISEIVAILSTVEKRDALRVYRDLTTAASDLVRVRAPDAEDDGSISLERGVAMVSESRDLLLAAACASVRSAATFRTGAMKEAVDYLRDVQLGQTERGSFIVTLLSPVPRDLAPRAPDLLDDPELGSTAVPFSRQVTSKLVESLHALKGALIDVDRGAHIEAFRERVPSGISANLCEAASKLAAAGDGVGVSLSWALTRPVDSRHASLSRIEFTRAEAATLQEAAHELRHREARPDERLQGVVVRLTGGADVSREQATLKAVIDGAMTSVNLEPKSSDRDAFIEAYRGGNDVIVEGELERVGQRWMLRKPRHVEVLPLAPEDIPGGDLIERTG